QLGAANQDRKSITALVSMVKLDGLEERNSESLVECYKWRRGIHEQGRPFLLEHVLSNTGSIPSRYQIQKCILGCHGFLFLLLVLVPSKPARTRKDFCLQCSSGSFFCSFWPLSKYLPREAK
ncbi:hypothetical protein T310_9961, partial [Rasamsonia emersonii CBS 393.64]